MKKRIVSLLLILVIGLSMFSNQAVSAAPLAPEKERPQAPRPLPTDRIIVRFKSTVQVMEASPDGTNPGGPSAEVLHQLSGSAGAEMKYVRAFNQNEHILGLSHKLPLDQVQQIVERLKQNPNVEFAEPDYRMTIDSRPTQGIQALTNDPRLSELWALKTVGGGIYGIDAYRAWSFTTGDPYLRVAVIDTGILRNHPDLKGRYIGGYDFISDVWTANDGSGRDADASDPGDWYTDAEAAECYDYAGSPSSWHGSHVSGTIAGAANNGIGITGINWKSKILPIRVLGKCGGYTSDIADGMRWAAGLPVVGVPNNPYPARVENLSLGGYTPYGCSYTYQSAIDAVTAAGTVVVVAAGNSADDASYYQPANCSGVITVGATAKNSNEAYYSNWGYDVELSAPGGDQKNYGVTGGILSTLNAGTTIPTANYNYVYYQGTSMATPHIAGIVSLMLSANPSLTPAQVTDILIKTVTPFPSTSSCSTYWCGAGIANAFAAVDRSIPIRYPLKNDRIAAGPYNAPHPTLIKVSLKGTVTSITINGSAATILSTKTNATDRTLTILPPVQSANGVYDLTVTIEGLTTTYAKTVFYSDYQTFVPSVKK